MTTKKQESIEEWIPKTAHEIAVGMFHDLPNILVPARHHLSKVTGTEGKTALKAVNRALEMVAECTTKFAKVPGPIRANFRDGDTFVILETETNRITADGGDQNFRQVNLLYRQNSSHEWVEITAWDADEWRSSAGGVFEAIIGAIAQVAAGVMVAERQ